MEFFCVPVGTLLFTGLITYRFIHLSQIGKCGCSNAGSNKFFDKSIDCLAVIFWIHSHNDEESTAGLLIDLRFCLGGRSKVAEQMIGGLIDAPVSSPLWKYPKYVAAETNWGRPPEWGMSSNTITPREGKRFMGPIVILTAGTASSTAEDFAISLREAGRVVLVGERTAGSAGNPISLPLPGGGRFEMATFRAYLPDGGEYVGIGLEPDVAVAPTKQDIRTGVDAVMEKGLEVLAGWDFYGR